MPPRLYSYCIPYDDGAAPNPYWEYCTLAICKPAIRRTAQIGDWIVGTGSRRHNIAGRVVYVMRVSEIVAMKDYDRWTRRNSPNRIPDINHKDFRRRLGDSIYDFSSGRPVQRPSVHDAGNIDTDLGGKNVLISDYYFYFGDKPIKLPLSLRPIIHQQQGHKVRQNTPYLDVFLRWLTRLNRKPNKLLGRPMGRRLSTENCSSCVARKVSATRDLEHPTKCL